MYNNIEIKNIYDGVKYTKNKIKIQKTRVLTFFFFRKKNINSVFDEDRSRLWVSFYSSNIHIVFQLDPS